jgi:serine/threonine protein kinase
MSPQESIGHYRIISKLGEGGMGAVYRATDTKLKREVAIKVLPTAFAADDARMQRFEREAQVLASLNHPNIAVIHGVEDRALILELVEGPTLAERIQRGPIPLDETLPIARQIAEALEYAHERGVVHRDLKPANIKITPNGTVKVLDFGLAKVVEAPAADPRSSPTMTISQTQAGVILGTAAYMAPEQARGKSIDRRADIWAFGVVLFEMLTGEQAFKGDTVADVLGAVIHKDLDLSRVPAKVQCVLDSCLQKDPKQRLQAVGDWHLLIQDVPEQGTPVALQKPPSRVGMWIALAAAGAMALTAAWLASIHFREKPPAADVVQFEVTAPEKTRLSASGAVISISPDGRHIAFGALEQAGKSALWVHSLDSNSARRLPSTEGVSGTITWSPDSRFILFAASRKLKKVEAVGGQSQTLCDLTGPLSGASWSQRGVILFAIPQRGLYRISDAGGESSVVLAETLISSPSFLPDGHHFFVSRRSFDTPDKAGIYLGSIDDKPESWPAKRIIATQASAVYAPSSASTIGYVLFEREGALMAQALDLRTLQPSGAASPVADGLAAHIGLPVFSASATGILAWTNSVGPVVAQVGWYDRNGKLLETVGEPGRLNTVALSPDGKRIAVSRYDEGSYRNMNLWIDEVSHRTATRLTFTQTALDWFAVWSPDASQIVWSSNREGNTNLYRKSSSGAGPDELLLKTSEVKYANDWSRDGRFLLFSSYGKGSDIWFLPMIGDDRKPRIYLQTEFDESQPRFSPDGRFVAYTSNESGQNEVFVRPFPDANAGRWMVSKGGGNQPQWRADGKELFYVSADSKMMAVEVSLNPSFTRSSTPTALFSTSIAQGGAATNTTRYSVSADGKRFVINCVAADAPRASAPITVVINWQTRLKR